MKIRKLFCGILAVVMMLSVGGCAKKETSTAMGDGEIPEELSIFVQYGMDYNSVYGFQLLEEKTGCKVNWIIPPGGEDGGEEKFNLMVVSGDLPDAIVYDWQKVPGGIKKYIDNNVIISLSDLVEKHMPNLTKFNKENPEIKKQYVTDEGEILYIPYIRKDEELQVYLGPIMRTDWLERLGLEIPTTTDELYDVLVAFKTRDPNGNGEADEIPMSGASFTRTSTGIGDLLWPFGAHYDFYVSDGKVKYGIMEPEFEEGMRYIVKLFSEGLIDEDYILLDRTKMEGKIMNDKVGFVYSFQPSNMMATMSQKNPDFRMEGISHLKGPSGENKCFQPDYGNSVLTSRGFAVTTANKNPVGTLKWLDCIFSEEGTMMMNFGKEGVTYNMVDGYPVLTDLLLNNPDGLSMSDAFKKYIAAFASGFPMIQDWRYYEQYLNEYGTKAIKTWAGDVDTSGILPNLIFTSEEQSVISQKMAQIKTYTEEMLDKLTIGNESLDNLPQIRETIRSMGIDDVLKIYQASYERYQAR